MEAVKLSTSTSAPHSSSHPPTARHSTVDSESLVQLCRLCFPFPHPLWPDPVQSYTDDANCVMPPCPWILPYNIVTRGISAHYSHATQATPPLAIGHRCRSLVVSAADLPCRSTSSSPIFPSLRRRALPASPTPTAVAVAAVTAAVTPPRPCMRLSLLRDLASISVPKPRFRPEYWNSSCSPAP